MKAKQYRGYTIEPHERQNCGNYLVKTPSGEIWKEIAANVATAKKWIDADLLYGSIKNQSPK